VYVGINCISSDWDWRFLSFWFVWTFFSTLYPTLHAPRLSFVYTSPILPILVLLEGKGRDVLIGFRFLHIKTYFQHWCWSQPRGERRGLFINIFG
jgi:hypothetical protein